MLKRRIAMATEKKKIDMQKVMEIYKKAGTPGEPHKLLAKLEGIWTTRSRSWSDPVSPPQESIGTVERKLILDGHYLQEEYRGDMMGMPYLGISLVGYNNHTKKYETTWCDSMSTAIFKFEGTASRDGKTITQECKFDDPVRGPALWRTITRIKDDNTTVFEMYLTPKGKKEEKMMEMTSLRKEGVVSKAA
jgi:hypothetical protein